MSIYFIYFYRKNFLFTVSIMGANIESRQIKAALFFTRSHKIHPWDEAGIQQPKTFTLFFNILIYNTYICFLNARRCQM